MRLVYNKIKIECAKTEMGNMMNIKLTSNDTKIDDNDIQNVINHCVTQLGIDDIIVGISMIDAIPERNNRRVWGLTQPQIFDNTYRVWVVGNAHWVSTLGHELYHVFGMEREYPNPESICDWFGMDTAKQIQLESF